MLVSLVGMKLVSKIGAVFLVAQFTALMSLFLGAFFPNSEIGTTGLLAKNFKNNFFPESKTLGGEKAILNIFAAFAVFSSKWMDSLSGLSRSGDLKNPQTALSKGLLASHGLVGTLYLVSIFLFGGCAHHRLLQATPTLMVLNGWPHPMVCQIGMLIDSFGASLQFFTNSPKIIQAIANDDIVPFFRFFKGTGEPRRANLIPFVVCLLLCLTGDLNFITPLIVVFFFLVYTSMVFVAFISSWNKDPSFRPTFRYYNTVIGFLGLILDLVVMFVSSWYFAALVILITFLLSRYISHTNVEKDWGDTVRGLHFQSAKMSLLALNKTPTHSGNWRPQLLVCVKMNVIAPCGDELIPKKSKSPHLSVSPTPASPYSSSSGLTSLSTSAPPPPPTSSGAEKYRGIGPTASDREAVHERERRRKGKSADADRETAAEVRLTQKEIMRAGHEREGGGEGVEDEEVEEEVLGEEEEAEGGQGSVNGATTTSSTGSTSSSGSTGTLTSTTSTSSCISTGTWSSTTQDALSVIVDSFTKEANMVTFTDQLTRGYGLSIFFHVVKADEITSETNEYAENVAAAFRLRLENTIHMDGFVESVCAQTVLSGIVSEIQSTGIGRFRPNMVCLNFPDDFDPSGRSSSSVSQRTPTQVQLGEGGQSNTLTTRSSRSVVKVLSRQERKAYYAKCRDYVSIIQNCITLRRAVLLLKAKGRWPTTPFTRGSSSSSHNHSNRTTSTIDVWWLNYDGGLLLLLPQMLRQSPVWGKCEVRIFMITEHENEKENLHRIVSSYLVRLRMDATVRVVSHMSTYSVAGLSSTNSSLTSASAGSADSILLSGYDEATQLLDVQRRGALLASLNINEKDDLEMLRMHHKVAFDAADADKAMKRKKEGKAKKKGKKKDRNTQMKRLISDGESEDEDGKDDEDEDDRSTEETDDHVEEGEEEVSDSESDSKVVKKEGSGSSGNNAASPPFLYSSNVRATKAHPTLNTIFAQSGSRPESGGSSRSVRASHPIDVLGQSAHKLNALILHHSAASPLVILPLPRYEKMKLDVAHKKNSATSSSSSSSSSSSTTPSFSSSSSSEEEEEACPQLSFLKYVDTITDNLTNVLLVRGSGDEVIQTNKSG